MASKDPGEPALEDAARSLLPLGGALGALLLIITFFVRGGNLAKAPPAQSPLVDVRLDAEASLRRCGTADPGGRAVVIQMVYGEDLRPWIEAAADRFARLCPGIQVKLAPQEDLAAVSAMANGDLRPTLWAPTDELSLRLLQHKAQRAGSAAQWQVQEQHDLARSPLVWLLWRDRSAVLERVLRTPSEEGQWARSLCAGVPREPAAGAPPNLQVPQVPGTWLELAAPLLAPPEAPRRRGRARPVKAASAEGLVLGEELERWGGVRLIHALPTRFGAGLSALYLLSYDFLVRPAQRDPLGLGAPGRQGQAYAAGLAEQRAALARWLHRCEAGVEVEPRPVDVLTEHLFAAGPAREDGVVTLESLTLPYLNKLDAAGGVLRGLAVLYPEPTRLLRHPALRFAAPPDQTEAAQRWLAFLMSPEVQRQAIRWGLRPAAAAVSVRDEAIELNPFMRLRRFGVQLDPALKEAPPPDGAQLEELLELWSEATGRS